MDSSDLEVAMPTSNSNENEMLLMMNESSNRKTQDQASHDYVELASAIHHQQLVIQGNCDMEMENFDDLLANQGIKLDNGQISVIEQDGQQYILLPNVSVSEVLRPEQVIASQQSNGSSSCISTSLEVSSSQAYMSMPGLSDTTLLTDAEKPSLIPTVVSMATLPTPSLISNVEEVNLAPTSVQSPHTVDIHHIIPSLCPDPSAASHPILQCTVCEFKANDELTLDRHIEEHRNELNEKLYKASKSPRKGKRGRKKRNTCRIIRTGPSDLASEPKKGPFLCDICGAKIAMKSVYKRHIKEHLNEKAHKCHICSESFNVESNLTLHLAVHSEEGDEGYKCPVCKRTFMRVASLKSHLPIHLEDETLICTECGDEFAMKSQLDLHMEQHRRDLEAHLGKRNDKKQDMYHNVEDLFNSDGNESYRSETGRKRTRKKAEPQQCMYCGKTFRKDSAFKRHVLIHTGEKPFSCNVCGRAFNQAATLKLHMRMHTGVKPFKCPHCPQVFTQQGNLRNHLNRAHSSVNRFSCTKCACAFKKLSSLNAHVTKHHLITDSNLSATQEESLSVSADVSNVTDQSEGDNTRASGDDDVIQQLLRSLNDDELNAASESSGNKAIEHDIVQQALQNSGVDPTSRDHSEPLHCDVTTPSEQRNVEMTEENSDDSYMKSVDSQPSASEEDHRNIQADPVDAEVCLNSSGAGKEQTWEAKWVDGVLWHQCMYCSKEFKKPSDLVRHIRTHTNERPFSCKICHKSFAVKTTLTSHERTHLHYKPYRCQVCSKSLSTSGSLKAHMRLHSGSKPYKCTQCDRSFRTSGQCHNHKLSHLRGTVRSLRKDLAPLSQRRSLPSSKHLLLQDPIKITDNISVHPPLVDTNEESRNHSCPNCDKSFKKSSHLRQHLRSHTGERPYSCMQCGKAFASSSTLKGHMKVHTGLKPFQCVHCNQSFASNHTLKRHMTIHNQSRPYMCPYCHKTFKTNWTCKKHIKTHANEQSDERTGSDVSLPTTDHSLFHLTPLQPCSDQQIQSSNQPGVVAMPINGVTIPTANEVDLPGTDCVPAISDDVSIQNMELETPEGLIDFNNNPELAQIDPNIIQDLNRMHSYCDPSEVNNYAESVSMETTTLPTENSLSVSTNQTTGGIPVSTNQIQDQDHSATNVMQESPVKCSGCSKFFQSQAHLLRHEETERNNATDFRCSMCCHSLESEISLSSHIQSHNSDIVHRCPVCFVTMTDQSVLMQHTQSHHSVIDKQVPVSQTIQSKTKDGGEPKRKRSGFYHLSKEQSEILQKIDPSQIMTLSEKILLSAVAEKDKVRLAQKPGTRGRFKEFELNGPVYRNVCHLCPKSFRKPNDLVRHIRTHTGDKPFKCDICGKSFAIKSTLKCHRKSHNRKKMFRCHICDVMYSSKASLKVHMTLHTGAKPYKCSHCPMMFRTPGFRRNHMTTHLVFPNKPKQPSESSTAAITPHQPEPSVSDHATAPQPSVNQTASTPTKINPQVVWPDLTLSLPVDTLINTGLLQTTDPLQVPLQVGGQNVQLDGGNITLQIDPLLMQPNLPLDGQPAQTQTTGAATQITPANNWSPSNVMIQPLGHLCLQPVNSTATPGEQHNREGQDINASGQNGVVRQLLHTPVLSQSTQPDGSDQPANQMTILQAVQQFLGNLQNSSNLQHLQDQPGVTFTLNPADLLNTQESSAIVTNHSTNHDVSQQSVSVTTNDVGLNESGS